MQITIIIIIILYYNKEKAVEELTEGIAKGMPQKMCSIIELRKCSSHFRCLGSKSQGYIQCYSDHSVPQYQCLKPSVELQGVSGELG